MTDADDLALLANTPAQAESPQHNIVQATRCISLNMNVNKTEYIRFKQKRITFTLRGKPLKLKKQYIYLGRNISSTERHVSIHQAKAWNAIDRLSIILKSDPSDKIKWDFFQVIAVSILWMLLMDTIKIH